MASGNDFWSEGPSHLTSVDWNDAHHRRSVAASLVKGAYVLDRDREAGRQGSSQALAPPWWEFFQFKLLQVLIDDNDHSIFGAIFVYKREVAYANHHRALDQCPWIVIAFRGTMKYSGSFSRDFDLDIEIIRNGLHKTSRFAIAMKTVRDAVAAMKAALGPDIVNHIWLTGHSLGAALGMMVGKTMAREGSFLKAFLFNPPYVSAPFERIIKNKKVRHGIRFAGTLIKAFALAAAADHSDNQRNIGSNRYNQDSYDAAVEKRDSFAAISGWIPFLFVNQEDPVCSEYIGYFEHRKKMEDMGAGDLVRLTSQHSLGHISLKAFGLSDNVDVSSEPLHVIPSAHLTENLSPSRGLNNVHGLPQWWSPNWHLKWTVYKYA